MHQVERVVRQPEIQAVQGLVCIDRVRQELSTTEGEIRWKSEYRGISRFGKT